jgi:hypothetical protein
VSSKAQARGECLAAVGGSTARRSGRREGSRARRDPAVDEMGVFVILDICNRRLVRLAQILVCASIGDVFPHIHAHGRICAKDQALPKSLQIVASHLWSAIRAACLWSRRSRVQIPSATSLKALQISTRASSERPISAGSTRRCPTSWVAADQGVEWTPPGEALERLGATVYS